MTVNLDDIHIAELEEFGLDLTCINQLEKYGITSLRELLNIKLGVLDTMRQIGPKRRAMVLRAVKAHRAVHYW